MRTAAARGQGCPPGTSLRGRNHSNKIRLVTLGFGMPQALLLGNDLCLARLGTQTRVLSVRRSQIHLQSEQIISRLLQSMGMMEHPATRMVLLVHQHRAQHQDVILRHQTQNQCHCYTLSSNVSINCSKEYTDYVKVYVV